MNLSKKWQLEVIIVGDNKIQRGKTGQAGWGMRQQDPKKESVPAAATWSRSTEGLPLRRGGRAACLGQGGVRRPPAPQSHWEL